MVVQTEVFHTPNVDVQVQALMNTLVPYQTTKHNVTGCTNHYTSSTWTELRARARHRLYELFSQHQVETT